MGGPEYGSHEPTTPITLRSVGVGAVWWRAAAMHLHATATAPTPLPPPADRLPARGLAASDDDAPCQNVTAERSVPTGPAIGGASTIEATGTAGGAIMGVVHRGPGLARPLLGLGAAWRGRLAWPPGVGLAMAQRPRPGSPTTRRDPACLPAHRPWRPNAAAAGRPSSCPPARKARSRTCGRSRAPRSR